MKSFFTPKEVSRVTGIHYQMAMNWNAKGFICSTYKRKGKYRLYTFKDLTKLQLALTLRKEGYSIQKQKLMFPILEKLLTETPHPFIELSFLIEGDRMVIFPGDMVVSKAYHAGFVKFKVSDFRKLVDQVYPI